MIKFSKKTEYALIALSHMAYKNLGELTTARELSDKYDISLELMGKILQSLARNKIITSVQGVKGGYHMLKKSEDIKIIDVITTIDGPIQLANCIGNQDSVVCSRHKYCTIRKPLESIQSKFVGILDEISLKDFDKLNNLK